MAELKFDMQRLAADVMEKVLDEIEYKGRTLRDWIDGIASGEYVQAKSGRWELVFLWDVSGNLPRCTHCNSYFASISQFGRVFEYCPNCGVKTRLPKEEDINDD